MWTPEFKVIDIRKTGVSLLAYIEANQDDALHWANGGPGLAPFVKFYTNASGRLQTIFPSLMILAQRLKTDLGDALQGEWYITLEASVSGPEPNQLVADTLIYGMAIEALMTNIPSSVLMSEAMHAQKSYIVELDTQYDILRPHASAFLQIFQTQVQYKIEASGI